MTYQDGSYARQQGGGWAQQAGVSGGAPRGPFSGSGAAQGRQARYPVHADAGNVAGGGEAVLEHEHDGYDEHAGAPDHGFQGRPREQDQHGGVEHDVMPDEEYDDSDDGMVPVAPSKRRPASMTKKVVMGVAGGAVALLTVASVVLPMRKAGNADRGVVDMDVVAGRGADHGGGLRLAGDPMSSLAGQSSVGGNVAAGALPIPVAVPVQGRGDGMAGPAVRDLPPEMAPGSRPGPVGLPGAGNPVAGQGGGSPSQDGPVARMGETGRAADGGLREAVEAFRARMEENSAAIGRMNGDFVAQMNALRAQADAMAQRVAALEASRVAGPVTTAPAAPSGKTEEKNAGAAEAPKGNARKVVKPAARAPQAAAVRHSGSGRCSLKGATDGSVGGGGKAWISNGGDLVEVAVGKPGPCIGTIRKIYDNGEGWVVAGDNGSLRMAYGE